MNKIKTIFLAVCVFGLMMVFSGINGYDSSVTDVSRFFSHSPADRPLWLIVSGVIVVTIGIIGLSHDANRSE